MRRGSQQMVSRDRRCIGRTPRAIVADLTVTMPATEGESELCHVAEAFKDLMRVMPGSGLSLCDEGDRRDFKAARFFGASDAASAWDGPRPRAAWNGTRPE